MRTVITLGEAAAKRVWLEVVCPKCNRHGVLSTSRLIREHGARMPMTELRRVLADHCERLKAAKAHNFCPCHFPELPRLFWRG
jgi:hypothetical protein